MKRNQLCHYSCSRRAYQHCLCILAVALVLLLSLPGFLPGQGKTYHITESVVLSIAVSPPGDLVAMSTYDTDGPRDRIILVFDLAAEKIIQRITDGPGSAFDKLAFSKDGKSVLSFAGLNSFDPLSLDQTPYSVVKWWDIGSGRNTKKCETIGPCRFLNGSYAVTRDGRPDWNKARVYDLENGKEVLSKELSSRIEHAAVSVDGKYLATVESGGPVRVWEVPTGNELFTLKKTTSKVFRLFFCKGDEAIKLGVCTPMVTFYDARTGEMVGDHSALPAMAVSNDGKMTATKDAVAIKLGKSTKKYPDALHVLSTRKKIVLESFPLDEKWKVGIPELLQFSQDGRRLILAGGGSLRVWDISNLQP